MEFWKKFKGSGKKEPQIIHGYIHNRDEENKHDGEQEVNERTEAATETRRNSAQERRARQRAEAPQPASRETENTKIHERRAAAKSAAEACIKELNNLLEYKKLSADDKSYYEWVLKSAQDSYDKSFGQNKDTYTVEVIDPATGIVTKNREEGMPVDELIRVMEIESKEIRSCQEEAGKSHQRYIVQLGGAEQEQHKGENDKKLAWHSAYENVMPTDHVLRREAEAMMAKWEQDDQRTYSAEERQLQLGQALKQVLIDRNLIEETDGSIKLKGDTGWPAQELKRLEKTIQTLKAESKAYLDYHHTAGEDQHVYTEREADLIAKDQDGRYRNILFRRYKGKELSENFDSLSKLDQEYELAKLAVRDRRVLDLPKEKGREMPKAIFRINISEIAQRMAKSLADARLEDYYANSNWVSRKARALTENWNRLKFYDEALKEIMQDQDLLKAMEARSLADQNLAAQQADKRGRVKRILDVKTKKDRSNEEAAKRGAAYKPTKEEYYQLMDSVMEEYEHDVVGNRELGEKLKASDALNTEVAKLLVAHQKGDFPDRASFEAYVKQHLEPLVKAETRGKQFSTDAKKQTKAGNLLEGTNFWQLAESYKEEVANQIAEYAARCQAEGREVDKEQLMTHLQGLLKFDLQLGLKDRDMANNKPEQFLEEYEKYKNNSGLFKFFNKGGKARILFNPFTYGMIAGGTSGALNKAVLSGLSRRGLLVAGTAAGIGAFASFGVPIAVGAGMGAYWAWKRRRRQVEDDVRNAQRYEALGGQLSNVLDAKKAGLFKGKKELRYSAELQVQAGSAIAELKRILALETLSDDEKKKVADICARLEIKTDGEADLFRTDDETGKKYSSSEVVDSQLKILRGKLEDKFGLTDAAWQKMVGDARKALLGLAGDFENNIEDFKNFEGKKAAWVGAAAGAGGAIFGQKLIYWGLDNLGVGKALNWTSDKFHMPKLHDYFAHHGTTFDRARSYLTQGDRNTNLALIPLIDEAPSGGARSTSLIDQLRFHGTLPYDVQMKVAGDLHLHELFTGGGIKHFELLDGANHRMGLFDYTEATGDMNAVAGTVDQSVEFNKGIIPPPGGGGGRSGSWWEHVKGALGSHAEERHINLLYDNNTPETPDLNELKLFMNQDGSGHIHADLSRIIEGESYHGPHELLRGVMDKEHIKLVFTDSHFPNPIVLTPDDHGHLVIPEELKSFIEFNPNGTVNYKGDGWMGMAEEAGPSKHGGVDMNVINSIRGDGEVNLDSQNPILDSADRRFDSVVHQFGHKVTEPGKGYDMALTPALWRRKKINQPGKGENRVTPINERPAPGNNPHRQETPARQTSEIRRLNRKQARTEAEDVVDIASDQRRTDAEVEAAVRDISRHDYEDQAAANEFAAVINAAPQNARERIRKVVEKMHQEDVAREAASAKVANIARTAGHGNVAEKEPGQRAA